MESKSTFEKASLQHKDLIFGRLAEPHMQEFWDNSQEHKDHIINFMEGRKEPSSYYPHMPIKPHNYPTSILLKIDPHLGRLGQCQ